MEFHERMTTMDQGARMGVPRSEWTEDMVLQIARSGDTRMASQIRDELLWTQARKPYYSVWPTLYGSLLKTTLDLPGEAIHLPRNPILLRFPKGREPGRGDQRLHSILASEVIVSHEDGLSRRTGDYDATSLKIPNPEDRRGLCVWCNFGEQDSVGDLKAFSIM